MSSNKQIFDFFGVPIELGDTVMFADVSKSTVEGTVNYIEKNTISIIPDISGNMFIEIQER